MGVPLSGVSIRVLIPLHPDNPRCQPQEGESKGRDRKFQTGNQDGNQKSRKGLENLLVGSLYRIKGPGVLAGPLCDGKVCNREKYYGNDVRSDADKIKKSCRLFFVHSLDAFIGKQQKVQNRIHLYYFPKSVLLLRYLRRMPTNYHSRA